MAHLKLAVTRVAEGLAELHTTFEAGGKLMTNEAKLGDANQMFDRNFRAGTDVAQVRAALGDRDFERVGRVSTSQAHGTNVAVICPLTFSSTHR